MTERSVFSVAGYRVTATVPDDGRQVRFYCYRPGRVPIQAAFHGTPGLQRRWWRPGTWGRQTVAEALSGAVQWVNEERRNQRRADDAVRDALMEVEAQAQVARIVGDLDRALPA